MNKFRYATLTSKKFDFIPEDYFIDYDYFQLYDEKKEYVTNDKVTKNNKDYILSLYKFIDDDDDKWVLWNLCVTKEQLKNLQKYCQCDLCQQSYLMKWFYYIFPIYYSNICSCVNCLYSYNTSSDKVLVNQHVLKKTMKFCETNSIYF